MYESILQASRMLANLQAILGKARAFEREHDLEEGALLSERLIEDMFPLTRQIQSASDAAKFMASRLSGKEPPSFPDEETTYDELHERLQKTIDYLATYEASDFEGAAERHITLPFIQGMFLYGKDYFQGFAQPNFYFHVTTAYALLRKAGVPIGKLDYIGQPPLHPIES